MRKSRKTDFRQKNETSTRLKITFVDMTYPGQRPELPSLSHHFLLVKFNNRWENHWKPLFALISVRILLKQLDYSLSISMRR